MKAFMLFTGSGPLVILTSHDVITESGLLAKFAAKGIDKFTPTRSRSRSRANATAAISTS